MGWAKLDVDVIAREWRGYWQTGISPLAGWLPERDKPWRATVAPPALPQGHLAQGWPPFRNLIFDPALRETLLAVVGTLDSAELEAWWLEQLAAQPFLCEVGLQCLAQCQSYQGLFVEPLLENLRQFSTTSPSPGLVALRTAYNRQNLLTMIQVLLRPLQTVPPDRETVDWSVKALRDLGSVEAAPLLIEHFQAIPYVEESPRPEGYVNIRARLIMALGRCVDSRHIPYLLETLSNREESPLALHDFTEALAEVCSSDSVPLLLATLRSGNYNHVFGELFKVVEKCVDASHVPLLLECLKNEQDMYFRRGVADALIHCVTESHFDLVRECLEQETVSDIRWRVARALSTCAQESHFPLLLQYLEREEDEIVQLRFCFIEAIGTLANPLYFPILLEYLRDDVPSGICDTTSAALAKCANASHTSLLFERFHASVTETTREAVLGVLFSCVTASDVPALLTCLESEESHNTHQTPFGTRQMLLACLGKTRSAAALPALREALRNKETDFLERGTIAHWLCLCTEEHHLPLLLDCLKNETNRYVAGTIVDYLGTLKAPEVAAHLRACLTDDDYQGAHRSILRVLGEMGSIESLPLLLDYLKSENNPNLIWSAARAIGALGCPDAIPVLLECLRNEKYRDIRGSIAYALRKIGFNALDTVCAAWDDYAGEEAQEDLAHVLYSLATIDSDGD
ncbi:HEAT repeat domain-containing protein [Armatimonas sp.]|uniref:HEAT repeat domain-containing protein n=1 Tax=Armatimonas sp. TaxID=1872638 RepID=UPI00374DDA64